MSRAFVSKSVCGQFEKYRQLKKHEILAPSFDKLTISMNSLITLNLILSLSKDGQYSFSGGWFEKYNFGKPILFWYGR